MSYATFADVQAIAGRFAPVFSVAGKHPDQNDVTGILANVSAEIDAAIKSRGFDPTTLAADVQAALKDLNAQGALARALPGADVGPDGAPLLAEANLIWTEGLKELLAGTFPALAELEAGRGGQANVTAGNFWDDEPQYGSPEASLGEWYRLRNTTLAPTFARGMHL